MYLPNAILRFVSILNVPILFLLVCILASFRRKVLFPPTPPKPTLNFQRSILNQNEKASPFLSFYCSNYSLFILEFETRRYSLFNLGLRASLGLQ